MSDKDPRFEIENDSIKTLLREIGEKIGVAIPNGWGFTLALFEYEKESFFYISSANRADMVKVLREFIQRQGEN